MRQASTGGAGNNAGQLRSRKAKLRPACGRSRSVATASPFKTWLMTKVRRSDSAGASIACSV
jgi:hypothetical protein